MLRTRHPFPTGACEYPSPACGQLLSPRSAFQSQSKCTPALTLLASFVAEPSGQPEPLSKLDVLPLHTSGLLVAGPPAAGPQVTPWSFDCSFNIAVAHAGARGGGGGGGGADAQLPAMEASQPEVTPTIFGVSFHLLVS